MSLHPQRWLAHALVTTSQVLASILQVPDHNLSVDPKQTILFDLGSQLPIYLSIAFPVTRMLASTLFLFFSMYFY